MIFEHLMWKLAHRFTAWVHYPRSYVFVLIVDLQNVCFPFFQVSLMYSTFCWFLLNNLDLNLWQHHALVYRASGFTITLSGIQWRNDLAPTKIIRWCNLVSLKKTVYMRVGPRLVSLLVPQRFTSTPMVALWLDCLQFSVHCKDNFRQVSVFYV